MKTMLQSWSAVASRLLAILCSFTLVFATSGFDRAYASDMQDDASVNEISVTSFTVHVMNGPNITDVAYEKSFTQEDLASVLNAGSMACNYLKGNTSATASWNVLAVKNYVTLQDLFTLVKNSDESENAWLAFTNGAGGKLRFATDNIVKNDKGENEIVNSIYNKWDNFTYSAMSSQTKFYKYLQGNGSYQNGMTASDICNLAIAFDRASAEVPETSIADATYMNLKNGTYSHTTQFIMGLDSSTVNALPGVGTNMGKRLPQNVTDIYVYPASITPATL